MTAEPLIPACPRCAYDLSGVAAAGGKAGRGRCPECGLEFDWAEALDHSRWRLPWLYEHATPGKVGLARAWATLARVALPWRFWAGVSTRTRVGPGRLLLWLPVLIVPLHIAWGAINIGRRVHAMVVAGIPLSAVGPADWMALAGDRLLYPLGGMWRHSRGIGVYGPGWSASFLFPLGATLGALAALAAMRRARRAAGVGGGQVLRAGVYGAGWLVGWYALWTLVTLTALVWQVIVRPRTGVGFTIAAPRSPLAEIIGRNPTARAMLMAAWSAWFGAWWWFAAAGLGFRRPRWAWAVLMLAAGAGGIGLALLDGTLIPRARGWFGW